MLTTLNGLGEAERNTSHLAGDRKEGVWERRGGGGKQCWTAFFLQLAFLAADPHIACHFYL